MQEKRWQQRFSNFIKAFKKLEESVLYTKSMGYHQQEKVVGEMLKEGLIHRFEYTHELACNVMKDYAIYQRNNNVGGSRDATREALKLQLINNGDVWMNMISSRNQSTHTYNEETAGEIYTKIMDDYYPEFLKFRRNMEGKISTDL